MASAPRAMLQSLSSGFASIVAHPEGLGSMLVLTEGTSLRGTVFNLSNTILGAGILGLPHAAEEVGIVLAPLMLISVAALQDLSAWMLLVGVDITGEVSYAVVAEVLYHRWLGLLVDLMVLLNNFGVLTSYVVILGDLIPPFMGFLHAPSVLQNRTTLTLICTVAILLPLSSLRKMGLLRYASLGCLLAIGVFVVVMVCMGSGWVDVTRSSDGAAQLFSSDFTKILGQLPVMLFAYNCNMNVPILYGELRRQHQDSVGSRFSTKRSKMMVSMHASLLICCTFYCIAAAEGCRAFRNRTKTNIFDNFDAGDFAPAPYFKVAYAIVLSCSFPVMCFSCVASLHRLLWHCLHIFPSQCCAKAPNQWDGPQENSSSSRASPPDETRISPNQPFMSYTEDVAPSTTATVSGAPVPPEATCIVHQIEVMFLVGGAVAFGLVFPNLGVVFGLTGGVCGSFLSFIFPGLIYLKAKRGVLGWTLGGGLTTFGASVCIVGTILVAQQN